MFNFKKNFESYCLSYQTEEFLNKLEDDIDQNPFLLTEGRKTWFKEKPAIINEIDKQLRSYFKLKNNNKLVFSLYLPPKDNKETIISDQKQNVLTRIIISSIDEYMNIGVMGKESDKIKFDKWTAYQTPPLVGGILKYKFDNSKYVTLPQKKGFRSVRKIKPISKRYILLFDYIINEEDLKELSDNFKSFQNNKDLEIALEKLKN